LFCPDCGSRAKDTERFCPACGYPLERLRRRLEEEQRDSLGWAERILGRPPTAAEPPRESTLVSFKTGEEPVKLEEKEKGLKCERCGERVERGTLCSKCGDRLPIIGESDPYFSETIRGFFKMLFAPRHFAINFPYPVSGGTLQPALLPGVFAAFFILTLPLGRPDLWLKSEDPTTPLIPSLVGIPLYVLGTPLLTYLTAWLIHLVGVLLGGSGSFRRALRALSAALVWLLIIGTLRNITLGAMYFIQPTLDEILTKQIGLPSSHDLRRNLTPVATMAGLVLIGWLYSWMFGGLYRLSWWKTLVHTLATYVALLWWTWLFVMVILPLRAGGFL